MRHSCFYNRIHLRIVDVQTALQHGGDILGSRAEHKRTGGFIDALVCLMIGTIHVPIIHELTITQDEDAKSREKAEIVPKTFHTASLLLEIGIPKVRRGGRSASACIFCYCFTVSWSMLHGIMVPRPCDIPLRPRSGCIAVDRGSIRSFCGCSPC